MKTLGYNRPLYLLPFDHRQSYVTGMFHFTPPLTADEHAIVVESKQVIYDGFQQALMAKPRAGILVDEEFGAGILRDAIANGYVTALSTEKSGSDEFEFEYGTAFAEHIEAVGPTFAKVLVRLFMFELLVPATKAQMERTEGGRQAYDRRIRPELMLRTIRTLQDAGIEPDVWKVEGLDRREDCERVVETARRDGRGDVGCIVLGRGADETRVVAWLDTAASVPGFIGFAVGRTTFWNAVAGYEAHAMTRQEASTRVAQRFCQWAAIFERTQPSHP